MPFNERLCLPCPLLLMNIIEKKPRGTKNEIASIAKLISENIMNLYVVHTGQANQRQHMLIGNQVIIFRATL